MKTIIVETGKIIKQEFSSSGCVAAFPVNGMSGAASPGPLIDRVNSDSARSASSSLAG